MGRLRDAVVAVPGRRLHRPFDEPCMTIQRDQASVEHAGVHLVAEHRDAAVDVPAAYARTALRLLGNARVPLPDQSTRARVQREDVAVRSRRIDDAVDHDRRRLQPGARLGDLPTPRLPQLADVGRRNLGERAVVRLRVVASVGGPLGRRRSGDSRLVELRRSGRSHRGQAEGESYRGEVRRPKRARDHRSLLEMAHRDQRTADSSRPR